MTSVKLLIAIALSTIIVSCGNNIAEMKKNISIKTNTKNNSFTLGETLEVSLENPKNYDIGNVTFLLDGNKISNKTLLNTIKLGVHTLEAQIQLNDTPETIATNITVLNNKTPKVYHFEIINEFPHDITSYTQGLEFYNGELYESTGQYGESKLRKVDYKTGEPIKSINLPNQYFGEGLTVLNNRVYQLTWKRGTGFIYNAETFEKTGSFKYNNSKQGWGICNDGKTLYKSDGTEKIWTLDPETLMEQSYIQAYHSKGKVVELNELEWVNGKIYANRWQKNGVAIINPKNGAVEGVIDFSPLHKKVTQHPKLDVLNGIAYNPETQTLFVTGKRWDKLFEVKIIE
ncbi:glutaminyl-peptide cyclotransferase [Mangrovimonas spongiae]|uniref:Glutaminyl-peptide cyclotransferase n=1 Tax=Mangrovimonas spongiae TaxID=2494697 RepID=A0A3R9PHG9_9FLAO|nr:glutaminyl-peptide cyclotransferase [Mangrovimonas spongiae]RSK38256.1 glutaminyl-peptide cyclotransferase [Mangrovimonas spongiae]